MSTTLLELQKPVAVSHQSLWLQIPELIGIPLVAFIIITLIKEASATHQFAAEDCAEIGMDLAILAAGACGAVFANDTLYDKWGTGLIIYGILTVLTCLVFVSFLARTRRWQAGKTVSDRQGALHLAMGALPLCLVTAILILGYTIRR